MSNIRFFFKKKCTADIECAYYTWLVQPTGYESKLFSIFQKKNKIFNHNETISFNFHNFDENLNIGK